MIQIKNMQEFEKEVLKYEGKVLVDFWAEWCGPCQMMLPMLSDFDNKYSDKIKVCKVNVDEASDVATQYRIMSIPTLTYFNNGKIIKSEPGIKKTEDLVTYCEV